MTLKKNHAIIVGAGIAGLLSAKVAAQYFTRVTLVDRDVFPENIEPRRGVPQAVHLHVLLLRGLRILQEFFPTIERDLLQQGAVPIDWGQDTLWMNPCGWVPRFTSGVVTYNCSRWMLEHSVREKVFAASNIEVLASSEFQEFIFDNNRHVKGICIQQNGEKKSIEADLVIDACGKNSRVIKILEQNGYSAPQESRVNSHLGYASCHFEIPSDFPNDWKQLYVQMKPPTHLRGGVLYPVEGNKWIVTLIGGNKDYPPGELDAFMDFAKSLRDLKFYDTIYKAKAVSRVYCYRNTESRLRHFHKMKSFPQGLLCIGDSVCAFNPVYGQGMTVSALSAKALQECLQQNISREKLAKTFFHKIHKTNFVPWLIASSEDKRIAEMKQSLFYKCIHLFFDRTLYLATRNQDIQKSFLEILHMTKGISSLLTPKLLFLLRKKRD